MIAKQDPLFRIPYSLPSNAHSISIATRRPTSREFTIGSTAYLPDYGGVLEIPGGHFKNNGLGHGSPFFPKPYYVRAVSDEITRRPSSTDCIAIASYLKSQDDDQFTIIRALNNTLYLDTLAKISCDDSSPTQLCSSRSFAHVPYSNLITGIKYQEQYKDLVIVKFDRGLKLLRLNKLYQVPSPELHGGEQQDEVSFPKETAIQFLGSFPEKPGSHLKDACFSLCSESKIGIASSSHEGHQVRLYDLSRRAKNVCNCISWSPIDDTTQISLRSENRVSTRRRVFIPAGDSKEVVRQLDYDPTHMFNLILTTSHQVSLIDPRINQIVRPFALKNDLESLLPGELFRKTSISFSSSYQFYSMSNMNLRVFDRRFTSTPITTIGHMLCPSTIDFMNINTIDIDDGREVVCLSSSGQLALITLDRSRAQIEQNQVVTPRSLHQPIHEPCPSQITERPTDELLGITTTTASIFEEDVMFSVIQLSQEGDICIRGYHPQHESQVDYKSRAEIIVQRTNQNPRTRSGIRSKQDKLEMADQYSFDSDEDTETEDDVLEFLYGDEASKLKNELASQRAQKKLDAMRTKLNPV